MKKKKNSYDYIVFAATIIIIAAVSAWYVPTKLAEPASFVFQYCHDTHTAYVEYSRSMQIAKVTSTLLGGGVTYYKHDNTAFGCPVVAPEYISDECRRMVEVSDWTRVCEGDYVDEFSSSSNIEDGVLDDNSEIRDDIIIDMPIPHESLTSPIHIEGEARGTWYFEASFPIVVVDWDGRIIGEGYATAQDDWMTEDLVPFEADIAFDVADEVPYRTGAIIFRKDNPSGLPEYDDAYELPIVFGEEAPEILDIEGLEVR